MTMEKPNTWSSGQLISVLCIMLSTALSLYVFLYCRLDHDMKLLALGAVISQVSALMATASTLLVGKSFESQRPSAVTNQDGGTINVNGAVTPSNPT